MLGYDMLFFSLLLQCTHMLLNDTNMIFYVYISVVLLHPLLLPTFFCASHPLLLSFPLHRLLLSTIFLHYIPSYFNLFFSHYIQCVRV